MKIEDLDFSAEGGQSYLGKDATFLNMFPKYSYNTK